MYLSTIATNSSPHLYFSSHLYAVHPSRTFPNSLRTLGYSMNVECHPLPKKNQCWKMNPSLYLCLYTQCIQCFISSYLACEIETCNLFPRGDTFICCACSPHGALLQPTLDASLFHAAIFPSLRQTRRYLAVPRCTSGTRVASIFVFVCQCIQGVTRGSRELHPVLLESF